MRVSARAFAAFLSTCVLAPLSAQAFSDTRERVLEARIRALEQRLSEVEAKLEMKPPSRSSPTTQRRSATTRSRLTEARTLPSRPNDAISDSEAATAPPPSAPVSSTAPAPGVEAGAPAEAPQETFVFRENSVTLKPRHFEVSTEADYTHNNGFLQTDSAFASATSVRLGILDWLELNTTIPAFTSTRTRGIGPFRTQSKQVSGFGDVLLQANARVHEQTSDTPGVVLSLGGLLPTGVKPYDFSTYQPNPALRGYNPNPIDLNASYLARGAWGLVTNMQFYKTVDPLILFFGTGLRYLFPQGVQGHTVRNGVIYTYNFGFSFAISEKSTLGFQVLGAYQSQLSVDRHVVPQSELAPVSVRVSLIQRILPNTWIDPSLGAGLTRDAPSLDIGVGVRHRF